MAISLTHKPHTHLPAPTDKAGTQGKPSTAQAAGQGRQLEGESFSRGADANPRSLAAGKAAQPMAGAFNLNGPSSLGTGKSNSLASHYRALDLAQSVNDRAQTASKMAPVSAGLATAGAVGLGLAMAPLVAPAALTLVAAAGLGAMSARLVAKLGGAKAAASDAAGKKDLAELNATRTQLRGLDHLDTVQSDTLAVINKALKF